MTKWRNVAHLWVQPIPQNGARAHEDEEHQVEEEEDEGHDLERKAAIVVRE